MKSLTLWQVELIPWYVFAGYWFITWLRVNRTKATEKSADRLITVAVVVIGFTLLFEKWTGIGPLGLRFVPENARISWLGITITCAGVIIAVWARYSIGVYWSARVSLKEGHQLIRSGPYAFVRHPIYTGMFLAALGTAFVVGEWRGLVAAVLLLGAHSRKALREESLLTREFGQEYAEYRRSTGFLFPRLWSRGAMDTPGEPS